MPQRRFLGPILGTAILLAAGCTNDRPQIPVGGTCVDRPDEDCVTGLCLRLDSNTAFCTQTCDKIAQDCTDEYFCRTTASPAGDHCVPRGLVDACNEDGDCPAGHRCDTSPGPGEGICFIPVNRDICAPCNSSSQCPAGGSCFQTIVGEQFCTTACQVAAPRCDDNFFCADLQGIGEQCVPDAQTCSGLRPICAPCRGDADCGGFLDLCVENLVTGELFCGIDCEADLAGCPAGFGCVDLSAEGVGPWQCVPNATTCVGFCDADPGDIAKAESQCGFGRTCNSVGTCVEATDGRLCAPCADDDDCRQGAAVEKLCMVNVNTAETFCADDCTTDACPLGFSCIDVEAFGTQHRQCVPTRGSCLAGTGRLGDDCSSLGAEDCLTGICLDFGRDDVCSARCQLDGDCEQGGVTYKCCAIQPDGISFDCSFTLTGGVDGVCAPFGGNFGDDCTPGQPPCRSGLCLDIGTARVCTEACTIDSECDVFAQPSEDGTFGCSEAQDINTGESVSICFPSGGGGMGADCTFGPAACASRLCIKSTAGNVCSVLCASDGTCPEDWVCDPDAKTVDGRDVELCFPPNLRP